MRLIGACSFCGAVGKWEGGFFDIRKEAVTRRAGWSATFPWNHDEMPDGCDFSPESLEEHDVTTRFACPDCYRGAPQPETGAAGFFYACECGAASSLGWSEEDARRLAEEAGWLLSDELSQPFCEHCREFMQPRWRGTEPAIVSEAAYSALSALMDGAAQRGWSDLAMLCVACDYIDQRAPEAFDDYVAQRAAEEEEE